LLAVDWTVESEVVQAAELLEQWRKRSPIEVTDALKLLGKQVAYQTNLVRAYAIDTLAAAPDEELSLYILQLVQALKFENIQETGVNQVTSASTQVSSLATFLIGRAEKNIQLANYLYWYLKVELQDPTHGARYREIFAQLQDRLSKTSFTSPTAESKSLLDISGSSASSADIGAEAIAAPFKSFVDSAKKIGSTLRGTESSQKSNEDSPSKKPPKTLWDVLSEQDLFLSGIMDAQMSYGAKSKKDAKEAHLRSVLAKEGFDKSSKRDPFPLPCAPEVMVNGVNPQTAKVFKSAVYPALVEFHIDSIADKTDFGQARQGGKSSVPGSPTSQSLHHRTSYRAMVKTGDDLRQDQLVIMMIKLMDGLLKRASLDMCLTPYSIIATSPTSGMIEFVERSQPLSQILASNSNSILQFLQANAPQKGAKYDIRPDAMANYIRSCAGYCVITYLLGVGDRHLDNLMITQSGYFFHIDFGFMFGRDPKPLPPAFRLTREVRFQCRGP
jgi:phosphatidylinositol 3-kinase